PTSSPLFPYTTLFRSTPAHMRRENNRIKLAQPGQDVRVEIPVGQAIAKSDIAGYQIRAFTGLVVSHDQQVGTPELVVVALILPIHQRLQMIAPQIVEVSFLRAVML